MKKNYKIISLMLIVSSFLSPDGISQNAWINEIHYDNANSDVNESVEVVVRDAENYNLADFTVLLYNGGNGATYNTKTLDLFTAGTVSEGYSFFYYVYPTNGLQNGAPDGLALSYQGILVSGQFLSYEGSFTATNGPANGLTSSDIGVSEPGTNPAGNSLQLSGTGFVYEDFTWMPPAPETPGQLDNDQFFGEPPTPEPSDYPGNFDLNLAGLVAHLSWVDSEEGQIPEYYLVIACDEDSIMNPADGVMQADDPDLSDGSGSLNVEYGTQACTFYRLDGEKFYYFKIFPYTNAGQGVNFKTDDNPPFIKGLTPREMNGNDFEDGSFGSWVAISVASDEDWSLNDQDGAYKTTHSIQMDGHNEKIPSNDWFISPSLNLDFSTNETLEFHSKWDSGNDGNELTLKYSADYYSGDPGQANWTELTFEKAPDSGNWVSSGIIALSGIGGDNIHIAFQYLSNDDPRKWKIDEIEITGVPVQSSITVTSPADGDQWERAGYHDISWAAENNQANMRIELTINASSENPEWIVLNPSVPASEGTWVWYIPPTQPTSGDCRIRVTDFASKGSGYSELFSIIKSTYIPKLVITEIMYNSPESGSDTLEFIELFNDDDVSINMEGYYFSAGITYTYPAVVLDPGAYSLLAIDSEKFESAFGIPAGEYHGSLSNNGESITFLNCYDMVVDSLTFNDSAPWPSEPDGYGPSLNLCDPGLDNALAANWNISTKLAYINANGDSLFATPGEACLILPKADFSGNPIKLYEGETVDFTDLSKGAPISWFWEFEGGEPATSNIQNPSGIRYNEPGLFNVTLSVTNLSGTDAVLKEAYIDVMPVGLPERSESTIRIYPNPNTGSFHLSNSDHEDLLVSIYSVYGQQLLEQVIKPGDNFIDLYGTAAGIYIIRFENRILKIPDNERMIIY